MKPRIAKVSSLAMRDWNQQYLSGGICSLLSVTSPKALHRRTIAQRWNSNTSALESPPGRLLEVKFVSSNNRVFQKVSVIPPRAIDTKMGAAAFCSRHCRAH